MTGQEDIKGRLARLRRRITGLEVDGSTRESLLTGLLAVVDETMLPREVALGSGGVTILAAKRRLFSVNGDPVPDESEAGAIAALADDLAKGLVGTAALSVTSRRPEALPDPSEIGISVAALSAAWGVTLPPERAGPVAALSFRAGAEDGSIGAADLVERLRSLAEDCLDDLRAQASGSSIAVQTAGATSLVVYTAAEDGETIALFQPGDLDAGLASG